MTKQRLLNIFVLLFTVGTIVACASIVSKSSYPVTIKSSPAQADITIKDETGKAVYDGKTPTTVTLNTKAGYFKGKDYTVTFSKEGYDKHEAVIKRGVDTGWYIFGNILFGGLIGWFIVDPITGAMWKLPDELSVDLTEQKTSQQEYVPALHIVTLDDVPKNLRSKLIRIK